MKFIKIIQKDLAQVAICAAALTSAYSYSSNSVTLIKQSGAFIIKVEQELSNFFNKDNSTPYNNFVLSLGKTLSQFEHNIDHITRASNDTLSHKAYAIAQEARKHFNAAYGVIKQYNEKSFTEAGKFVSEINLVFDAEIAFASITTKLQALLKDAEAAQETELITVIQQLLAVVQKKKNEWSKKSKPSLLLGLTQRMKCQ